MAGNISTETLNALNALKDVPGSPPDSGLVEINGDDKDIDGKLFRSMLMSLNSGAPAGTLGDFHQTRKLALSPFEAFAWCSHERI